MRAEHPGCGGPAWGMGYNSSGHYYGGWVGNCGDGGTDMSTYYLLCVNCRESYMEAGVVTAARAANTAASTPKVITPTAATASTAGQHPNSYSVMNNNANFLLELASAAAPAIKQLHHQQIGNSSLSAVDELLPVDPNPFPLVPFQCFTALGVTDEHLRLLNDELVLDTDAVNGQQPSTAVRDQLPPEQFQGESKAFTRSVSVGGQCSSSRLVRQHE